MPDVDPDILRIYPIIRDMLLKDEQFLAALGLPVPADSAHTEFEDSVPKRTVSTLGLSILLTGYLDFSTRAANMVARRLDSLAQFEQTSEATLSKFANIGKKLLREIAEKRRHIPYRTLSFHTEDMYERAVAAIRRTRVIDKIDYEERIAQRILVIDADVFDRLVVVLNEQQIVCAEVVYKGE